MTSTESTWYRTSGASESYRHAIEKVKLDARRKAAARRSAERREIWNESWRENVATEPGVAKARARRAIKKFAESGEISIPTAQRGFALIHEIFDRESVYATVAPDDGGLVFYWRAGEMSLEIDVYEDTDDGYWWCSRTANSEQSGHHPYDLSVRAKAHLKSFLARFSKEVEQVNPDWRDQQL